MKEFVVKEHEGFRLRVRSWKSVNPGEVNAVEFIQECKNEEGEVEFSSTYQFFMTDEEIKNLCEGLLK